TASPRLGLEHPELAQPPGGHDEADAHRRPGSRQLRPAVVFRCGPRAACDQPERPADAAGWLRLGASRPGLDALRPAAALAVAGEQAAAAARPSLPSERDGAVAAGEPAARAHRAA